MHSEKTIVDLGGALRTYPDRRTLRGDKFVPTFYFLCIFLVNHQYFFYLLILYYFHIFLSTNISLVSNQLNLKKLVNLRKV